MLTYHEKDEPTVHIMPGQPLLLAGIFSIFGAEQTGLYIAKILMIIFGVLAIYFVYLIGCYVANIYVGWIAALFLTFYIPQVLTDNLLLTESPFHLCLVALVYFSIKLANEHQMRDFFYLMIAYLIALMFKTTIALFPFVLLIYFIIKKYPIRLAFKQFGIAAILLLLVLGPWWIRNYVQFDEFIPLTGGSGNPLLLGTYQGDGYRIGEDYDTVYKKIDELHPPNMYEHLKLQEEVAMERMKKWWKEDKRSFVKSYTIMKTETQWITPFYWIEIFHLSKERMTVIHEFLVKLGLFSLLVVFFTKKWREYSFLIFLLGYNTALNNLFFAYDRYNQPYMFIMFIMIGSFIIIVPTTIKRLIKDSP
ncbi:glycosyltransferase family 39 protein [Bacillaceae bacterium W0354]